MPLIPPRVRAREEMATVIAGLRVAARLAADPNHSRVTLTSRDPFGPGDEIPPLRHGNALIQQEYERVYADYTDQELAAEYRLRMAWEIGNGPDLQQRMQSLLNELYHGIPSPLSVTLEILRARGLFSDSDVDMLGAVTVSGVRRETTLERPPRIDLEQRVSLTEMEIAYQTLERTFQKLPRTKLEKGMLQTEGNMECSICMTAVGFGEEILQLSCRHWFHPGCIIEWLKVCQTCPFCREAVEFPSS